MSSITLVGRVRHAAVNAWVMLPWRDDPLFSPTYEDGRPWVAAGKPFRVPVVALISEWEKLPEIERNQDVEVVMLDRQVVAYGDVSAYVYRQEGDGRLEGALEMLNMAIFFVMNLKDVIDPAWRNTYTIRGAWVL